MSSTALNAASARLRLLLLMLLLRHGAKNEERWGWFTNVLLGSIFGHSPLYYVELHSCAAQRRNVFQAHDYPI